VRTKIVLAQTSKIEVNSRKILQNKGLSRAKTKTKIKKPSPNILEHRRRRLVRRSSKNEGGAKTQKASHMLVRSTIQDYPNYR